MHVLFVIDIAALNMAEIFQRRQANLYEDGNKFPLFSAFNILQKLNGSVHLSPIRIIIHVNSTVYLQQSFKAHIQSERTHTLCHFNGLTYQDITKKMVGNNIT